MARKNFGNPIDQMTAYCTYCPKMCRFSCPAAQAEHRETVTPWGMMRLFEMVKNNAIEPSEEVAEIFYHCLGCRRCQTWCYHANDVPQALWQAQQWMASLGYLPEPIMQPDFSTPTPPLDEVRLNDSYDPNCHPIAFLPASYTRHYSPELIYRVGKLMEVFCGHRVRLLTHISDPAADDVDILITDDTFYVAKHRSDTSWSEKHDSRIIHLYDFIARIIATIRPPEKLAIESAMIHDSCIIGRQLKLYEPIRHILRVILYNPVLELQFNRQEAYCCGGAPHYMKVAEQASQQCSEDLLSQAYNEGGRLLITTESHCKYALRENAHKNVEIEVTDILELLCQAYNIDTS